MKKNDKYYVPEIEEFYIGFEYEYNPSLCKKGLYFLDWLQRDRWYKESFGAYCLNDGESERDDIDNLIEYGGIRIKYLDREDIESFGFVQESLASFVNKDSWYIEWMPEDTLDIYCVSDCRFKGKIKNKSELKVLLKQLGI
jgi:hypothetical protein